MVVTGAAQGVSIPRGSVVESIDGITPRDLLLRLLPYTRADGTAAGKRRALLEVQLRERIEYCDVFQGLLSLPRGHDGFQVRFVDPAGARRRIDPAALDLGGRQAMRTSYAGRNAGGAEPWSLTEHDGIGVLRMPTWAMYQTDWNWQQWLDARLDEATESRGLVIDLRENEGGLFA